MLSPDPPSPKEDIEVMIVQDQVVRPICDEEGFNNS